MPTVLVSPSSNKKVAASAHVVRSGVHGSRGELRRPPKNVNGNRRDRRDLEFRRIRTGVLLAPCTPGSELKREG
jgi:hypothetical protein